MTDQELIGYLERLDRRFGELSQKMDAKVDGLREELREENRQTRIALEEQIRQTRAALEEQIGQTRAILEEQNRQTRVVVEGLRSDIQLVAEGVVGFGEKLEKYKLEVLAKFRELKAMVAPYYVDLDGRVDLLEEKAGRWDRNVLEVMRERLAKG